MVVATASLRCVDVLHCLNFVLESSGLNYIIHEDSVNIIKSLEKVHLHVWVILKLKQEN